MWFLMVVSNSVNIMILIIIIIIIVNNKNILIKYSNLFYLWYLHDLQSDCNIHTVGETQFN